MPGAAARAVIFPPLKTNFKTPSAMDAEAIKRRAFHDQHILVVALSDPRLGWADRMALKAIGEKLFGTGQTCG